MQFERASMIIKQTDVVHVATTRVVSLSSRLPDAACCMGRDFIGFQRLTLSIPHNKRAILRGDKISRPRERFLAAAARNKNSFSTTRPFFTSFANFSIATLHLYSIYRRPFRGWRGPFRTATVIPTLYLPSPT